MEGKGWNLKRWTTFMRTAGTKTCCRLLDSKNLGQTGTRLETWLLLTFIVLHRWNWQVKGRNTIITFPVRRLEAFLRDFSFTEIVMSSILNSLELYSLWNSNILLFLDEGRRQFLIYLPGFRKHKISNLSLMNRMHFIPMALYLVAYHPRPWRLGETATFHYTIFMMSTVCRRSRPRRPRWPQGCEWYNATDTSHQALRRHFGDETPEGWQRHGNKCEACFEDRPVGGFCVDGYFLSAFIDASRVRMCGTYTGYRLSFGFLECVNSFIPPRFKHGQLTFVLVHQVDEVRHPDPGCNGSPVKRQLLTLAQVSNQENYLHNAETESKTDTKSPSYSSLKSPDLHKVRQLISKGLFQSIL